jgi:hypothetical protein
MSQEEGHISHYRLWSYVNGVEELSDMQEVHLTNCERCMELFRLCVLTNGPSQSEPRRRFGTSG